MSTSELAEIAAPLDSALLVVEVDRLREEEGILGGAGGVGSVFGDGGAVAECVVGDREIEGGGVSGGGRGDGEGAGSG